MIDLVCIIIAMITCYVFVVYLEHKKKLDPIDRGLWKPEEAQEKPEHKLIGTRINLGHWVSGRKIRVFSPEFSIVPVFVQTGTIELMWFLLRLATNSMRLDMAFPGKNLSQKNLALPPISSILTFVLLAGL